MVQQLIMDKFIPLHEEIFLKSATTPESRAIIDQNEGISFNSLDHFSSKLAWQLQESGIGPGSKVGIYLHPDLSLAISIFAVLKSGAAYIPLSPHFPEERIRFILHDAAAKFVITDKTLSNALASVHTPLFIPDWPSLKQHDERRVLKPIDINPSDLAYILYTSGSTGNPKGVMIEHRNLSYYIHWFCQSVISQSRVGLPLTSSFIFAAAVTQFYSTLLSGKTLHMLDPFMVRQPEKLLEWYATHPEMGLYCVPTLWSEILHYLETRNGAVSENMAPSCVYLSGEAVTDVLLKRCFRFFPNLQLWNLYGPTEATANLTATRLYPENPVNIGKPLEGTKIFIVGDDLALVDTGAPGELLASGPGIARGYLNLPGLTSKTFFPITFNGGAPIDVYRTGDLVKEDESGLLIYLGRKDQQVKIRGFRIELPEIEQALLAIPEVKHAILKVVEDRQNGKRLAAYLVYKREITIPVNELRKHLRRTLPDFMVPEVFVTLEHLPQLPNGKIDRKLLPLPGIQRPDLGYQFISPVTPDEKRMIRVWEEVLGIEGVGLEDNFFDLGGNSLKANAIVVELNAATGVSIQIKNIFDALTPGSLVRHIALTSENQQTEMVSDSKPAFVHTTSHKSYSPEDEFPGGLPPGLSENQKALWFVQHAYPTLSAYNILYSIAITGSLDLKALEKALSQIIDKYPILKTKFQIKKNQNREEHQVLNDKLLETFNPQPENLPFSSSQAHAHATTQAALPFNLDQALPFRMILYELEDHQFLLAFIVHHIVFDGSSFEIFLRELSFFYDQEKSGFLSGPTVPAVSYNHFCEEEMHYLSGIKYSEDRQYWQQQLLSAPTHFEIPTDFTRPATVTYEGGQVRSIIDPILKSKLKKISDDVGASMFMTCLAAFSILLYRHTDRKDFLVGIPVANRVKKTFVSMMGYLVNTMLFRAKIDPGLSFMDWLGLVREQILENLHHSRFPFSRMSEVIKTERIPGINPFFQVMFAYHETNWEFSTRSGINGMAGETFFGCSKFDLFTEIFDRKEDTEIVVTYSSQLYHPATVAILLDHFIQLLEHLCISPEAKMNELILHSPAEYNRIVYTWNQNVFTHENKENIVDLIDQQIERTPDLPALVSRHEVISYREMGHKTDVMASNLRRLGFKNGMTAGIHIENSPVMVMCIIAVFKAGGIYIPMDPYYPQERLRYVIEKTRTRFLVVDDDCANRKQELSEQIIPVSKLLIESADHLPAGTYGHTNSDGLAYIMFTSGSTGNPKGVMVGHDSLRNLLVWMKMEINLSPKDTVLSTASINFDISFIELFAPLISGARLVLEKRSGLQAPEKIEAILNEMKVNIIQFVPSGLKALCDAGTLRRASHLRCIISGGEKLSKILQEQIFGEFDGELINSYGPTEATVYVTCWHCLRDNPLRTVPIGTPIFNASMYILNENLEPAPIGITGEIYIGGDVLADGYFEDPEQTSSRFLANPFIQGTGNRIYKTGDLGRFLHNGSVEILGRSDHQVKVRGFRIELGEVESVIQRFPGVRHVSVQVSDKTAEDVRLSAYLIPEPGSTINKNELRDFLRLHLPVYMIPGHFMILPKFPSLPNGKLDTKSLVSLRPHAPKIPEFIHHQMNETEVSLSAIWNEILDHDSFTLKDNFFEAGGHSLLLVRMKELIAEKLNAEVSIVDLFHYPSISSLAAFLRKDKPENPISDIAKRVAMRNRNIKQQIIKRIFPDKNQF